MSVLFSKEKRIHYHTPQYSLNRELGRRLVLLIAIPFLLFCLVFLGGLWGLTSRQMRINQENIRTYVRESVRENLLAPYEVLVYLNRIMDSPSSRSGDPQTYMDMVMDSNPLFIDLFILDGEGRVIHTPSSRSSSLGKDYSPYPFFVEPEENLTLWAQPVISSATSAVSYAISLKRPDGICFVCYYSFDGIQSLVEKLSTPNARIGILNEDLFFMAHTDHAQVENRLQDRSIDFSRHNQILRSSGRFHLVQWSPIEEYHLIVVLYEKLLPFYAPFLLTILAFIFLFLGLILLISQYNRKQLNRLHEDLEELISVAEGINGGRSDLKFRSFQYRELSRLADSFNRMTGTLRDSYYSLHQAFRERDGQYRKTREREEELNVILENITSGVIFLDRKLSLLRISRRASEQLNLPIPKGWEGTPLLSLITEESRGGMEALLRRCRDEKTGQTEQFRWGQRIFEVSAIPVIEDSVAPGDTVLTLRDITDAVEAEVQLNQARRLESLGKLAGGVAHDFNNILQVFYGYIDQLKVSECREEREDYLANLEETADKGTDLVKQLLSFGRWRTKEKTDIDLDGLIGENRLLLEKMTGDGIDLRFHLNCPGCLISARRSEVERILANLLVNARDAMDRKGTVEVRTSQVQHNGEPRLLLEVEDHGSGIARENLDRIFDPFFTTKEIGKGTGLGLSTVIGIVKEYGGELDVQSRLGEGSVFRLYFPPAEGERARD